MLSRTADNLFWMCRYTERAENTARMLDVNLQMSLLPQDAQTREGSWLGVLRISELQGLYQSKYASISPHDVLQYMVLGPLFLPLYLACGGVSVRNRFEQAADRYAHTGAGWWPWPRPAAPYGTGSQRHSQDPDTKI